jgi:hypothetical protein
MRSSRSSELRQSRNIEIPIYKAKIETAEGKMDRISKYIASLKSIPMLKNRKLKDYFRRGWK